MSYHFTFSSHLIIIYFLFLHWVQLYTKKLILFNWLFKLPIISRSFLGSFSNLNKLNYLFLFVSFVCSSSSLSVLSFSRQLAHKQKNENFNYRIDLPMLGYLMPVISRTFHCPCGSFGCAHHFRVLFHKIISFDSNDFIFIVIDERRTKITNLQMHLNVHLHYFHSFVWRKLKSMLVLMSSVLMRFDFIWNCVHLHVHFISINSLFKKKSFKFTQFYLRYNHLFVVANDADGANFFGYCHKFERWIYTVRMCACELSVSLRTCCCCYYFISLPWLCHSFVLSLELCCCRRHCVAAV